MQIAYRNLVGVTHTEAEAKAEAEGVMVKDGPDDAGNYYERPGKLSDYIPGPFPNEEAARAANNGAYPPDLCYIVSGRHGGLLATMRHQRELFSAKDNTSILTSQAELLVWAKFCTMRSLNTETVHQQLPVNWPKDVATFLKWISEPEHDDRKRMVIKAFGIFTFLIVISYYIKRHHWLSNKSKRIVFVPKKK